MSTRPFNFLGIISFFVQIVFIQVNVSAQNCYTPSNLLQNCGAINVTGGLCNSQLIFCIGDSVGVVNNSGAGIDSSYICWGDGTISKFANVFSGCKKHLYKFPNDSCVPNGQIGLEIQLGILKLCGNVQSFTYITTPIAIKFKPKASFSLSPNPACVYEPITISDQSCPNANPSASYFWDFGDGNTSTSQTPSPHSYSNAGTYNVILSITNNCGTSTDSHPITIKPPTVVAPLISLPNSCSPANFTPDVNSQNATSFLWNFSSGSGNINLPPDSQPQFTLPSAGTYGIHLAVTGCCSGPIAKCIWDTSLTVYTAPNTSISNVPDFCGATSFNPLSYFHFSGGTINSYSWAFPGGSPSTSTSSTPGNISYNNLGTYIIILVLNTPCGSITLRDTFSILPPTIVQPIVSLPSGCSPVNLIPDVNSQNATGFTWSIIGGSNVIISPQDSQPSITLNASGNFIIHLQAQGCCTAPTSDCVWDTSFNILQGPIINQTAVPDFCGSTTLIPSAYITISGAVTNYSWSFPGGSPSSSSSANPGNIIYSSPGTYVIQLNVTSPCGPKSVSDTFIVQPPTVIQPISNISSICTPLTFVPEINSLNATGFYWSTLAGTALITQPTDSQPNFLVNNVGLFTIRVVASGCCIDSQSHCTWDTTLTLTEGPGITTNVMPLFCNSAIINPSNYFYTTGGISSYSWTFPGGIPASSTISSPGTITYSSPGIYIITLTLNGPCGTISKTDTVKVGAPPAISILSSSLFGCDTLTISFANNSPNNQTYLWTASGGSFVGGSTNTSISPIILFNSPGIYSINVEVFSAGCPSITNTLSVNVGEAPHLQTIAPTPDVCDTMYFIFSNYFQLTPSISDSGYSWIIYYNGNNIFSNTTTNPPAFQIGGYGQYIVKASVWNACDTILLTDTFNINPPATIVLNNDTIVCKGSGTINLTSNPLGGVWTWNGNIISAGSFDPNATQQVSNYLLYSYGALSCAVKDSFLITVFGADINAGNDTVLCQNNGPLSFTGNPAGGSWSGNGITNTITGYYDPSIVLSGTDSLYYIINDPLHNCMVRDLLIVTVISPTAAAFSIPDSACINQLINFNDTISNTTASWNFGDSPVYIFSNSTTHTYATAGTYQITLIIQNQYGCLDTISQPIVIAEPPNAIFSLDIHKGCAILPVNITNLSNYYGTTTYYWDYGNMVTNTLYNPGVIYFDQGQGDSTIYHISLKSINGCGAASYEDSIVVYPIPVPEFGLIYNDSCSPVTIHFANVTSGNPDNFYWYINGGFISSDSILSPQVFVTDSLDSTYTIMLISSNTCGVDTIKHDVIVHPNTVHAFFNTDIVYGCKPLTVTFTSYVSANSAIDWDFGDGNFANGDTVIHTYDSSGTFTIWQRVDNYCGYDSISQNIIVFDQPDVSFIVPPINCGNESIFFQNTSTHISGSIWNYGDGGNLDSSTTSPSHFYNSIGSYIVTLVAISNGTSCRDTFNVPIQIVPFPQAVFTIVDNDGCAPLTVDLISNSVGANYFNWDVGNGDTLNGSTQFYTYINSGSYTIHLIAVDNNGCKDDTSFSFINVHPVPIADFDFKQIDSCIVPSDIQFQNLSLGASSFYWNFGIFGNSNQENPKLNFTNESISNTSLIAFNTYGCSDTISKLLKVYAKPEASFTPDIIIGCPELKVTFSNTSLFFNQVWWNFGDGDNSNIINPIHYYSTGTYSISLIVGNDSTCFDTISTNALIKVYGKPTAYCSFKEITDTVVNPSGIYQFFNNSIDATSWHWNFDDGTYSNEKSTLHRFYSNGTKYITLIAYDDNNCSDTCNLALSPDYFGTLFIPNAFSPNAGTEETKYFISKGVGLKEYLIEVYSPFGELVWDSHELIDGQPTGKWDGTKNGKELPQGAYAWKVRAIFENGIIWSGMSYFGSSPKTTGSVMLIR